MRETGRTHSSSRFRRTWLAAFAVILVSGPVLTHDGASSAGVTSKAAAASARSVSDLDLMLTAAARRGVWRAYQFNFCGSVTGRELCGAEGRNGKFIRAARRQIVQFRPHVATMNEMCRTQFWALRRQLAKSDWPMRGTFIATHKASSLSCPTKQHGDALLTRRPMRNRSVDCLAGCNQSKRRIEHRVRMCVTTKLRIKTRVCVVHVGTDGQDRQIEDLITELNRTARRMPVLIGGDFNVGPAYNELDRVYFDGGWGASGRFEEADACTARKLKSSRCNESTRINRKLDYVFLARRWFRGAGADATWARFSDHDPLHAWFRQCRHKVC